VSVEAMVWVLDWSASTGATRLVAIALAEHADRKGANAWPSLGTLTAKAKVDRRTAQRALHDLGVAGEIERTGTSEKGTAVFRFPMRKGGGDTPRAVTHHGRSGTTGGAVSDPKGGGDTPPEPSLTVHEPSEDIRAVFDHWKTVMGRNGHTRLTDDRRRKIKARLKEGYTVEQLKRVIEAVRADPFYMGQNDRRRPYNDFKTIFRDAQQVDGFLEQVPAVTPEYDGW
jgi:uncharacterized phage protein (TIGR02220 family)